MPTFTVMTFNVRGAFHQDGANAWPHRAQLNIATIRQYMPDLIGFQELQSINVTAYEQHLPEYDRLLGPPASDPGERSEYVAIYWKPTMFDKLASGSMYLSETPDKKSIGWDASLPRVANWVRLRHRESGQSLFHLNTHLDHRGVLSRQAASKFLIAQVASLCEADPTILTGDFNSIPMGDPANPQTDNCHALYMAAGYTDAFLATGGEDTPTFATCHNFQGADYPRNQRIDWVLTKNDAAPLTVLDCVTVTDAEPPLYPSDHYPVLCTIKI